MIEREAIEELLLGYLLPPEYVTAITDDVLALYAPVMAELEAARTLRAAVQPLGSMAQLNDACAAYDAVVKARSK